MDMKTHTIFYSSKEEGTHEEGVTFMMDNTVERGHMVAQLVEALRYKQEGGGIDIILLAALRPWG